MPDIAEDLRPALAIFIKELDGHLAYFTDLLAQIEGAAIAASQKASDIPCETKVLEHRFHVIKGGASFFKLDEIRSSAARGEAMVRNQPKTPAERLSVDALRQIVQIFGEQSAELKRSFFR